MVRVKSNYFLNKSAAALLLINVTPAKVPEISKQVLASLIQRNCLLRHEGWVQLSRPDERRKR